ncbi:2-haloalkanoic acid dehalogenase [Fusarium subglutinans]|uniref:2-haloalkanoic acid dehalogenase n=1 Tax=Gibberella subglutinans TaxID=42677 RepID=A0A8H5Q9H7_GIBSU|nr:2-haloalkanoic acid dehalogenase [Fusarium subglutinans]KAF5609906.1 2-haloalkanoic acid dehalogenase [Fusarium subglutinans]
MGEAPLSLTFLCQGFAFAIPQSIARVQSPKLAASLDAAQKISQNPVITVKDFSLDTVNCMVEFFKSGCYEVDRRNLPSVLQAGSPAPEHFMRDVLTCHLQICAIGTHYGVPKLCELARDNIQKVFGGKWFDSVFLFTAAVVLKSKDDKLQRLLVTLARGHLHSLTTSNGFDHVTMLKSFHPKLREPDDILQKNGDQANSATAPSIKKEGFTELEALRLQVSSLKQQVITVSSERDQLREQISAASVEREELRQSLADTAAERYLLQNELSTLAAEKEKVREVLEEMSAPTDHGGQGTRATYNKKSPAEVKAEESEKVVETLQRELRVTRSESGLLKARWDKEKIKSSILTQENNDLKKSLELERRSRVSITEFARDDVRNALKDEQKVTTDLTTRLTQATQTLEAERKRTATLVQEVTQTKRDLELERHRNSSIPLRERDRMQETISAQKSEISALVRGRDEIKRELKMVKTEKKNEIDRKWEITNKMNALIQTMDEWDECRHCGADFGSNMSPSNGKYVVFDIVGTCVSYDKLTEAVEKQLGEKLRAENVKPSLLVNIWLESAEREYTNLSITARYVAFDRLFASLFYRMLWLAGIEEPRSFASEADIEKITRGYMELEPRPDLKECFDKLRAAGFTVRGLTAGDYDRVLGYFDKAGIEFPKEHLMSCDSFGVGKPDLKAYASTFEELKGAKELWFAAAHMWDVSSAKQVGFKSAYCSVLEKEPCVDIFGEMDVMSDTLSEMADKIIQASS